MEYQFLFENPRRGKPKRKKKTGTRKKGASMLRKRRKAKANPRKSAVKRLKRGGRRNPVNVRKVPQKFGKFDTKVGNFYTGAEARAISDTKKEYTKLASTLERKSRLKSLTPAQRKKILTQLQEVKEQKKDYEKMEKKVKKSADRLKDKIKKIRSGKTKYSIVKEDMPDKSEKQFIKDAKKLKTKLKKKIDKAEALGGTKKKSTRKKASKKKATKKKVTRKKATKKKVTRKKATKKKVTKKKATRKKATKKKATKKKASRRKVAKKKVAKKKASSRKKATKKKATKKKARKKSTRRRKKASSAKKPVTRKKAKSKVANLMSKGKLGRKKRKSFKAKVGKRKYNVTVYRKNPIGGPKMNEKMMQITLHDTGEAIGLFGGGAMYSAIQGALQKYAPNMYASIASYGPVAMTLAMAGIARGAEFALAKSGQQNQMVSSILKGTIGASVVSLGSMLGSMPFKGSMAGVDYTPYSGVDYTPYEGVDYTPYEGVDYTPFEGEHMGAIDDSLGFRESPADFGAPQEYSGEEADFGAVIPAPDFF